MAAPFPLLVYKISSTDPCGIHLRRPGILLHHRGEIHSQLSDSSRIGTAVTPHDRPGGGATPSNNSRRLIDKRQKIKTFLQSKHAYFFIVNQDISRFFMIAECVLGCYDSIKTQSLCQFLGV